MERDEFLLRWGGSPVLGIYKSWLRWIIKKIQASTDRESIGLDHEPLYNILFLLKYIRNLYYVFTWTNINFVCRYICNGTECTEVHTRAIKESPQLIDVLPLIRALLLIVGMYSICLPSAALYVCVCKHFFFIIFFFFFLSFILYIYTLDVDWEEKNRERWFYSPLVFVLLSLLNHQPPLMLLLCFFLFTCIGLWCVCVCVYIYKCVGCGRVCVCRVHWRCRRFSSMAAGVGFWPMNNSYIGCRACKWV